ncbi:MAG: rhomboid family intramembrane serine protease [Candidatus Pacebacteria bacterium]|nr:rhomboid family intramembrane serine protease [Candidatus Paceibacterota bacterium]
MIPLFDVRKSKKTPYITISLIIINVVLFSVFKDSLISLYGFIPGEFSFFHILTAMFLHTSIFHLLFNMWFLWIFGDNVEGKIGHLKFLFFYLFSGIMAALIYSLFGENLSIPVVGASGAISGVLGAYLILFPKNKLRVFPNFTFPSFLYIILWFLLQLLFVYLGEGGIAYIGHISGFITGLILILFLK